ncbi:hypothetical protein D3C76_260070 [compost metagenome]
MKIFLLLIIVGIIVSRHVEYNELKEEAAIQRECAATSPSDIRTCLYAAQLNISKR